VLVRLEDADGRVGWGETYLLPGFPEEAAAVAAWLVGQDPDAAAQALATVGGANRWVLSAVAMALDDLRARRRGISLAALYGEPVRDRVRAYASSTGYVDGVPNAEAWAAEATAARDAGFWGFKLRIGRDLPDGELASMALAKAAVPELAWMADVNAAWTADQALTLAGSVDELGLAWLEEPTDTSDYPAYRPIREALATPLAGGEIVESPGAAVPALTAGAFDLIQPDVSICGGVAPALRIAAAATAQGIGCLPHACNGAINLAATLQLLAIVPGLPDAEATAGSALAGEPVLEHDFGENPLRSDLLVEPIRPADGWIAIPDGPGLGVEVDEDVVARYRA
jgi:D-galactarolactone cycloisomerase